MFDGITQKGEFQGVPRRLVWWFFAVEGRLSRRDSALFVYSVWLALIFAIRAFVSVREVGVSASGPAWPLAVLAVAALLVERQSVRLGPRAEVSVSFLPIVLAAVIYGPAAAILVSFASLALQFRAPYARWFIWTCSRSIAAGCAGIVALAINGPDEHTFGRLAAAVVAATVVEQGGDFLLGSVVARLRGSSLTEIARIGSTVVVTMPLYIPITTLLVYTYRELSPWSVALFLFPAFAAQKLFLLYQ